MKERREGSTQMPIAAVPHEFAGNLSLSLAYCVGRRAAKLGEHENPYPHWSPQAKAWEAGRNPVPETIR